MSVRIRLRRAGKKHDPWQRIVVAHKPKARNGRFIETLGTYHPPTKNGKMNLERAEAWLSAGAQPSQTVARLIEKARAGQLPQTHAEFKANHQKKTYGTGAIGGESTAAGQEQQAQAAGETEGAESQETAEAETTEKATAESSENATEEASG